ncbi:MAG: hypothetical protein K8T10_02030 [Candidatus Eremiobacteraeota bacterium]|nr:hypothetical protein [Candidatus Eremiobacteraeota bacterium]
MKVNNKIKYFLLLLIVGVFLSYFVRQPYLKYCAVSPESLVEINIARNIADGKGFTLSIKETYDLDTPVVHSAAGERGLLYPLIISSFINKTMNIHWINIFLSLLSAILFFYLIKNTLNLQAAWLSFITLIFFPLTNMAASYLWNYTLIIFFLILSCLVLSVWKSKYSKIIAGGILSICFWSDPWALFYIFAFIPGLLLSEKNIRESIKTTGLFMLGFLIVSFPLLLWIFSIYNTPFPPRMPAYFQVKDYSIYLWKSFGYKLPGTIAFIAGNKAWVMSAIWDNIKTYSSHIASRKNALIPLLGLLISLPTLFFFRNEDNPRFPRKYAPLLSFSLCYFIGTCLFWSSRDFIKPLIFFPIFVIPLVYYFLCRVQVKKFPVGLLAAVLLMIFTLNNYIALNYNNVSIKLAADDYKRISAVRDDTTEWINSNAKENENVAAVYPWIVNFQTRQPAGILPDNLTSEKLSELLQKFNYNYIMINDSGEKAESINNIIENDIISWLVLAKPGLWRIQPEFFPKE